MPSASKLKIQTSALSSGYHQAIVSGLALLPCLHPDKGLETRTTERPALKAAVVGLGGGALTTFLHQHLRIILDVIEFDPVVVDTAKKWFDFKEGKEVNVFVGDGVARIKSLTDNVRICWILSVFK